MINQFPSLTKSINITAALWFRASLWSFSIARSHKLASMRDREGLASEPCSHKRVSVSLRSRQQRAADRIKITTKFAPEPTPIRAQVGRHVVSLAALIWRQIILLKTQPLRKQILSVGRVLSFRIGAAGEHGQDQRAVSSPNVSPLVSTYARRRRRSIAAPEVRARLRRPMATLSSPQAYRGRRRAATCRPADDESRVDI